MSRNLHQTASADRDISTGTMVIIRLLAELLVDWLVRSAARVVVSALMG